MDITTLSNEQLLQLARDNVASFPQNENLYDPNEAAYLRGLYNIATNGRVKMSRPGQATISMPGTRAEFDLTDGKIPLLRSKKIFFRSFLIENQWFLSGSDDVAFLKERNVSIWDSWVIPSTAVFAPTEKQTGFDVETYIRCHFPEVFKALVNYKAKNAISIPTFAQMQDFIASYTQQFAELNDETVQLGNIPKVRLVGGKIGAGAYGPAWRKWEDTRFVKRTDEQEDDTYLKRGFCLNGDDHHYDVYKRNIDQFADVIKMLRTGADSRRIIVSAWNAAKIDEAALPPCFTEDALVATPTGYVKISDIKVGDLVITGTGAKQPVLEVFKTPYTGDMLSFRVDYISERIKCTPNHPFLVKGRGFIEAKEIKEGDQVAIVNPKHGEDYTHTYSHKRNHGFMVTNVKEHEFSYKLSNDDYFALGYFLGNGWVNRKSNKISFAIPNKKKDVIAERLRRVIKVSPLREESPNVRTHQTASIKLARLYHLFGFGAFNKRIPDFVFNSSLEAKEAFLEGYFEADGCTDEHGAKCMTTISPSIAYGIQRLALLTGKVAAIQKQVRPPTTVIEGRTVNQKDTYTIRIVPVRQKLSTEIEDDYAWVAIKNIDSFTNKDFVYNLNVAVDHTYTVNNIVNHNCHSFFQFVSYDNFDGGPRDLVCVLMQRSADHPCGTPFNVAQYAALTHLVAKITNHRAAKLVLNIGDDHIYADQVPLLKEQFNRTPIGLPCATIRIPDSVKELDDFINLPEDELVAMIHGYEEGSYHPRIDYPVAV